MKLLVLAFEVLGSCNGSNSLVCDIATNLQMLPDGSIALLVKWQLLVHQLLFEFCIALHRKCTIV